MAQLIDYVNIENWTAWKQLWKINDLSYGQKQKLGATYTWTHQPIISIVSTDQIQD